MTDDIFGKIDTRNLSQLQIDLFNLLIKHLPYAYFREAQDIIKLIINWKDVELES